MLSRTTRKKNSAAETDAVFQMCSVQKAFLKIWQNSQENYLCQSIIFNKVFFKKKLIFFLY